VSFCSVRIGSLSPDGRRRVSSPRRLDSSISTFSRNAMKVRRLQPLDVLFRLLGDQVQVHGQAVDPAAPRRLLARQARSCRVGGRDDQAVVAVVHGPIMVRSVSGLMQASARSPRVCGQTTTLLAVITTGRLSRRPHVRAG
jgi:hypothetical protein